MSAKFDYLARQGRFAVRRDLLAGPITVLPPDAPKPPANHRLFWQAAEHQERFGWVMAQELLVALPPVQVLPVPLAKRFCRELVSWFAEEYRIGATFVIHGPDRSTAGADGDEGRAASELERENVHAHVLLSSRQLVDGQFAPRRHRALLPTVTGTKKASQLVTAGTEHALDAFNFEALVRRRLDRFLQRCGLWQRTRLAAIHPGYHVGPVRAVGAFINDVDAIARRPDAAAIFRKVRRLRLNGEIEARNTAAIEEIDPLLEHLADRMFTEQEVRDLVGRYVADKEHAQIIVNAVLLQAQQFHDPDTNVQSPYYVLPAYIAAERAIATLAEQMLEAVDDQIVTVASADQLASALLAGPRLSLVDITVAEHADVLDALVDKLHREGQPVVLATHLNKRRDPPQGVELRPLHWRQHFRIKASETVVVDEADCLKLGDIELLLRTALKAQARVVLIRRSYHHDATPSPILTAICKKTLITLGERRRLDLPMHLKEDCRVDFVRDEAAQIGEAVAALRAAQRKGDQLYLLCADPVLAAAIRERTAGFAFGTRIGPSIPLGHSGPVMVIHSPVPATALVARLNSQELRFLVPRTIAADPSALASQLRLSVGHLTSLVDSVRPAILAHGISEDRDPHPLPNDWPPEPDPVPQLPVLDEMRQEVGLEPDDMEPDPDDEEFNSDDDFVTDEAWTDEDADPWVDTS